MLATSLTLSSLLLSAGSFETWQAPGPGDVRSPCPALNSLANHGFLPHSGKGITLPVAVSGFKRALNIADDFTTVLWTAAFLVSKDPASATWDLSDVVQHNFPIEHDASLSRQDAFFGNQQPFNQTIFDTVLSFYANETDATIPIQAKAKYSRTLDSQTRNPKFQYGLREFILSYGENALFLSTMGDPSTGVAPLEYVKVLFEQERLPYAEGWRVPAAETSLLSVGNMIGRLYAASPEPLNEAFETVTMQQVRNAFGGKDPVTGVVRTLSCALAGSC
ncbi:Cloroperoxidase [Sphaerulina musiva SO2202]|uniref:Cloroperoxidase n=1 Tax=Sphaerulina musiva (strain SO2202) TaxID=692275 RepID=M3BRW7_SPHMS|nr:Cloroperoxidase [Sphaerulina musiva SO2202]EMF08858.1 Cloroperoxidase [Sphaerulina musiva SO2202]